MPLPGWITCGFLARMTALRAALAALVHPRQPRPRRLFAQARARSAIVAVAGLGAALLTGVAAPEAARADTAPAAGTPSTVSADALPTVQINGVVWSQVTVGNTVYVTGSFSSARPAGSPAGSNEVARANLLAYNITTGQLITSFNHTLNAQGRFITASPDGSRIYVVGSFTTVDGATHNRIAAFNTATGALVTGFTASVNSVAYTATATNSAVYVGGAFTSAGGVTRTRLAAFAASNGAVLTWAPTADNSVMAMVLSPDNSRVIVAGKFTTVNGAAYTGITAVTSTTGALSAWPADFPIQDSGSSATISRLVSDGTQIYGTAWYVTRGGNFEGRFAINPNTGAINWLNSCHGDTYDAFPIGQVLYSAGHGHDCSDLDDFNQDQINVFDATHWYTQAESTTPSGILRSPVFPGGPGIPGPRYANWAGLPHSSELNWYPAYTQGTYTGQSQAAWSVTGNSTYLSVGGEFPRVNGTAQQGLVRFALRSTAPNTSGPVADATLTPTAVSQSSGALRVAWRTTWDRDNETLTYRVFRDGGGTAIRTMTLNSRYWNRPMAGFVDAGLAVGSSHTYRVTATDPIGNVRNSGTSAAATVGSGAFGSYASLVRGDGASNFWPLSQAGGTTGRDLAGYNDLILGSTVTSGVAGPPGPGTGTATTFDGTTTAFAGTSGNAERLSAFSVEAWVRTTATTGGLIAGYDVYQQTLSANQDRLLYLDASGLPYFGAFGGSNVAVHGSTPINDGAWHHVVGTLSSTAGSALYVDGAPVAGDSTMRSTSQVAGYWRIGGDQMNNWANAPAPSRTNANSGYLAATIADVAVYPTALTAARVAAHVGAAPPANQPPVASFTSTTSELGVSVDGSGSSDPDGTVSSYAWTFGDGGTATSATADHTYAAAGTYTVTLTVTDNSGASNSVSHSVTVTSTPTPTTIASDTYNRTVASGWGSADVGGTWVLSGSAANFAVTPGAGTMSLPTPGDGARNVSLSGVSAADVDVTTTLAMNKLVNSGGSTTLYVVARRSSSVRQYRVRLRIGRTGAVQLALTKLDGSSTESVIGGQITVPGLTYAPGSDLKIRFQVSGTAPTTLNAKVWASSGTEPAGWQLSQTDSSAALTAPGSIGFNSYLSASVTNQPVVITVKSLTAVAAV